MNPLFMDPAYGGGVGQPMRNPHPLFDEQFVPPQSDVPSITLAPNFTWSPPNVGNNVAATNVPPINQSNSDPLAANMNRMKFRESRDNYDAENQYGFQGGYQFGTPALIDEGYLKPGVKGNEAMKDPSNWTGKDGIKSLEDFRSRNDVQDKIYKNYRQTNSRYLKDIHGIDTSSLPPDQAEALLDVAHGHGHVAAAKVFRGEEAAPDGNGVSPMDTYEKSLAAINGTPKPTPEQQAVVANSPLFASTDNANLPPGQGPQSPLMSSPTSPQNPLMSDEEAMEQAKFIFGKYAMFGGEWVGVGQDMAKQFLNQHQNNKNNQRADARTALNQSNANNQSKLNFAQSRDVLYNPNDPSDYINIQQVNDTNANGGGTYQINALTGERVTPEKLQEYKDKGYLLAPENVWSADYKEDRTRRAKHGTDWLDRVRTAGDEAGATLRSIDGALQLIDQAYQGTGSGLVNAVKNLGVSVGALPDDAVAAEEELRVRLHDHIAKRLDETKGSISDTELRVFTAAAANLSNTPEGNRRILEIYKDVALRERERQLWVDDWTANNPQRTAQEARAAWVKHRKENLDQNPIITEERLKVDSPTSKTKSGTTNGVNWEFVPS